MGNEKFFLRSKTIIGAIMTLAVVILPQCGISFSEQDGVFMTDALDAIAQGIGAALSIYGRTKAKDAIRFKKKDISKL